MRADTIIRLNVSAAVLAPVRWALVRGNIDSVEELGDVPEAVESVLEAFDSLKDKLEEV